MTNFKDYDDANALFSDQLKIKALPLLSWDFYGIYYQEVNAMLSDAKKIEEFSVAAQWENPPEWKARLEEDHVVVITDPELTIVFASRNMFRMNGYNPEEVVGKKPKVFQGMATAPTVKQKIKKAISTEQPFTATLINYSKDGTPYNCYIEGMPVFNKKGKLSHFMAFEKVA